MDTSRWRMLSWFVLAAAIAAGLSFVYEAATWSGCGADCVGKEAGYKAGAYLGHAISAGPTPYLLMLMLLLGLIWLATSKWVR